MSPRRRPDRFVAEVRDAVSGRAAALVFGVLLLQLGFIASYVGAFHSPRPHGIRLAVVAPGGTGPQLVARLRALPGAPLAPVAVTDRAAGVRALERDATAGVLVVDGTGTRDELVVAEARGSAESSALQSAVARADAARGRTVSVTDVVALQSGDYRGLTGFYLVIGWLVGGYLVASLLGVAAGARPATPRRVVIRLLAMIPYAVVSGLGGALIVGPLLDALGGHLLALWALGTLLVLSSAAATLAFQVAFGVLGIGITVLVFVVIGNPSAGGAYQSTLLPGFWRAIGGALPNGAGVDAVRRAVYFSGWGVAHDVVIIAVYVAAGAALSVAGSILLHRRADIARP